uniref:PIPK domain-containing protein n=1 Tax=Loa loa TaxID=7209 RepID=A0A1I7VEY0_LOALO
MSWFEIQSFVKFGPNYFSYVSTAMTDNKLTTLCKVYGVYRICYKNKSNGQQLKVDVLVMEYLFYRRNVKQVWDLKGSQRNRMASEGKRTADLVLLDENLVKDLWNNQLYVHQLYLGFTNEDLQRALLKLAANATDVGVSCESLHSEFFDEET